MKIPLYVGKLGSAALITPDATIPAQSLVVAMYLLTMTRDAPTFWRHHAVGVLEIRDVPGVPPPERVVPGAEFQLLAFSLSPEPFRPDVDNFGRWNPLKPMTVDLQFSGVPRDGAAELARVIACECVDGTLPIETHRLSNPDAAWRPVVANALNQLRALAAREGLHAV